MPVQPTYPGVYVEELPSGTRTITGVSTALPAFIGRTSRGPTNEPVTINSYADFEREFGGLWAPSMLPFVVQDYFLNGGSQAIVVRVAGTEAAATATFDGLTLQARDRGADGNRLEVQLAHGESDDAVNLKVLRDSQSVEEFSGVALSELAGRLADQSRYIEVQGDVPATRPTAVGTALSGGDDGTLAQTALAGSESDKTGLFALDKADLFTLLCIPDADPTTNGVAAGYCEKRRAMLLLDSPSDWSSVATAVGGMTNLVASLGTDSANAAVFFPRIRKSNPLKNNAVETFPSCGAVAGLFARTDSARGIWKAPAGTEAGLVGVTEPALPMTDAENGQLNPLGCNCIRGLPPFGTVVWGARTLDGNDRKASQWKYVPVRRLTLYLEESLFRGTQWVVFEPNGEPLWSQIRLNVGAFLHDLFRQGAFQGARPQEAYFVKCDHETTTASDIDRGIVNVVIGFAPLKPAEFVILKFQQIAGQN